MLPKGNSYEDCILELEWVGSGGTGCAGTLTILSPDQSSTKVVRI
jgi:hypothetical protein